MTEPDFEPIPASLIHGIAARLLENRPVREALPGGVKLNIDRLLPFLCVYRRDPSRQDVGTGLFVTAEASYLNAPGAATRRKGMKHLVRHVSDAASSRLGAFLILEVWSGDDRQVPQAVDELTGEPLLPRPAFGIFTQSHRAPEGTVAALEFELQRIKVHRQAAQVDVHLGSRNHPPRMTQLISAADSERINCYVLGLEIRPIYRNPQTGEAYENVLRTLRRGVTRALKKAFFTFALNHTSVRPQHYYVLGRKSLPKQVWNVDRRLADVSSQFKFLLLVTPVNAERSWRAFAESGYAKPPRFQYRPLETDPLSLKRRLLGIRTDQIEDPTLAHLFRQTQDELDRQITMLGDIGTRRFLPGSLQVYGAVEPPLLELARDVLRRLPASKEDSGEKVGAQAFARRAAREIRHYRQQLKGFAAQAVVRSDIYTGLLSTGGSLYIGSETTLAAHRVEGLLQHEVGTHLLTYYNGGSQPLRLLRVGLAGYDGLQEGLAVLSEYLVGGLNAGRLRTLAARVIATDQMIRGTPLAESFRLLLEEYRFEPRPAYTIALRVYRGGGLTKDAVYLRGLVDILDYLRRGSELEPLFVGKLAADHVPIIRELQLRGVLRPSPLRPRYLDDPQAAERLLRLRQGMTLLDVLDECK
jgi:uncharacterized protein (TIGR02421 family)